MLPQHRKVGTGFGRELADVEEAAQQATSQVLDKAIVAGRLIKDVQLTTTGVVINHRLGRQPEGWFVVDVDETRTVKRLDWNDRTLTLAASADGATFRIWVF